MSEIKNKIVELNKKILQKGAKMKKLLVATLFVAGVGVGLNAENLSREQVNQLIDDCLDNENVRSCQRLANSGDLISVEQCDKETCSMVGFVYKKAQNYQQALKYFKKACDANNAEACGLLGAMYGTGEGVKQNFSTAKKYFGKACDLGNQVGCDTYKKLNERIENLLKQIENL